MQFKVRITGDHIWIIAIWCHQMTIRIKCIDTVPEVEWPTITLWSTPFCILGETLPNVCECNEIHVSGGFYLSRFGPRSFPPHFVRHLPVPLSACFILLYHSRLAAGSWTYIMNNNMFMYMMHTKTYLVLESPHLVLILFCRWNQRFLKPCFTPHHLSLSI